MDGLRVLVRSDLPMVWRALCSTCLADGISTLRMPRGRRPATDLEDTSPTVHAVDLLDVPGVELRREIVAACGQRSPSGKHPAVLVLLDDDEELDPLELLGYGVRGMFTPDTALDLFPRAVRRVSEGEMWWSRRRISAALDALAYEPNEGAGTGSSHELMPTPREVSVLVLMAEGHNHLEVAEALDITAHTARTHIRNIMRKLDVHSRTEAVQVALRRGIIDLSDGHTDPP